jgi:hypothetical protein
MSNKRRIDNWRQILGAPVHDLLGGEDPIVMTDDDGNTRYLFRTQERAANNGIYTVTPANTWERS